MRLTTLTQFGARLSLAKLHVKKLMESSACSKEMISHIFYLVDPTNNLLRTYLENIAGEHKNVILLSKEDNNYTDFKRLKRRAPYGGDCNYDFLVRSSHSDGYFLTLHDDSIITTENLYSDVSAVLKDFDFGGYLDSRGELDSYRNIQIDGKNMTEQRIGTWFMFGHTGILLKQNYRLGDYRNYWKYYLHAKYGFSPRLVFHAQKIWLNGGFDFNIRARMEGKKLCILDEHEQFRTFAYHLTKITGFFAASKRDMLKHADKPDEIERWKDYAQSLIKAEDTVQIEHDKKFMMKLSSTFLEEGIYDPLLNRDIIEEIFG